jgi:hypothetical protein
MQQIINTEGAMALHIARRDDAHALVRSRLLRRIARRHQENS